MDQYTPLYRDVQYSTEGKFYGRTFVFGHVCMYNYTVEGDEWVKQYGGGLPNFETHFWEILHVLKPFYRRGEIKILKLIFREVISDFEIQF